MIQDLSFSKTERTLRSRWPSLTWDTEDDPENPMNWSPMRKSKAIFAMSSFVFITPLSSTIIAPALRSVASDLNITYATNVASPLYEIYGRVRVVQTWNFVYIIFNTACGGARSQSAILVLRFIAGLCGCATLGIGGGTLSDLFRAHDVSPSSFLGCFFLEETYPPLFLHRKKAKLEELIGVINLYTEFDYHLDDARITVLKTNLTRSFKLLATQPIIQVLALYHAYLYGNLYILYVDFTDLRTDVYGEPLEIAGLSYTSIARSPRNVPHSFGTSIFVAGALACTISVNICVIDTCGGYSASGLAAVSIIQCLAGFTFPYVPKLMVNRYSRLGYGWAGSIIGFIALGIELPAVILLGKYGKFLRSRSPYASKAY
ncbi:hypothetical protein M426DRAFT_71792 [Hypoxylon sp. CI-4A]|nr:hypothetical protein M426DRAFT_71792 [Hypoxylon sp. CI-4A]